jgi:hypothetical protein
MPGASEMSITSACRGTTTDSSFGRLSTPPPPDQRGHLETAPTCWPMVSYSACVRPGGSGRPEPLAQDTASLSRTQSRGGPRGRPRAVTTRRDKRPRAASAASAAAAAAGGGGGSLHTMNEQGCQVTRRKLFSKVRVMTSCRHHHHSLPPPVCLNTCSTGPHPPDTCNSVWNTPQADCPQKETPLHAGCPT